MLTFSKQRTAVPVTDELEQIIKGITARLPKVQCRQLAVAHPGGSMKG